MVNVTLVDFLLGVLPGVHHICHVCSVSDEDSNLATSPMPDMDSDSMLGGPVDEEERWLDALEKGELDDNGELKKEVDESLLTARQVRKKDESSLKVFVL